MVGSLSVGMKKQGMNDLAVQQKERALSTGEGAREGTAEVSYPGPIGGYTPHRHVTSSNAQCKGRSEEAWQDWWEDRAK